MCVVFGVAVGFCGEEVLSYRCDAGGGCGEEGGEVGSHCGEGKGLSSLPKGVDALRYVLSCRSERCDGRCVLWCCRCEEEGEALLLGGDEVETVSSLEARPRQPTSPARARLISRTWKQQQDNPE